MNCFSTWISENFSSFYGIIRVLIDIYYGKIYLLRCGTKISSPARKVESLNKTSLFQLKLKPLALLNLGKNKIETRS